KHRLLQFEVQPHSRDERGAASMVVAGVGDALRVEGGEQAAPEVRRVITLDDHFSAIVESAVAKEKPLSAEFEVTPVIAGEGVAAPGEADLIELAPPALPFQVRAQFDRLIDLRVSEGFMFTFVPAPTPKNARLAAQLLFEVDPEAVLHAPLKAVRC